MNLILVSTLTFLLGLIVGFFIGRGRTKYPLFKGDIKFKTLKFTNKLKVLHKSEPKTFDEKRSEALDKDKPMIKTFYK